MMYILEVYVLDKKNFYDSYSDLINFLADDDGFLDLDCFVFLLDLLCFDEEVQKKIVEETFHSQRMKNSKDKKKGKQTTSMRCKKDHFYRICVKYDLPLLEMIKMVNLEQYKKLNEAVRSIFMDIKKLESWEEAREELSAKLSSS